MTESPSWTHLVRFTRNGVATFAQLVSPKEDGDLDEQFEVEIATGDPVFNNIKLTGEKVTVARNALLAPFATVPIVINTGLNYKDHVAESLFYSAPVGDGLWLLPFHSAGEASPRKEETLTNRLGSHAQHSVHLFPTCNLSCSTISSSLAHVQGAARVSRL